jgi:hypothetical protein
LSLQVRQRSPLAASFLVLMLISSDCLIVCCLFDSKATDVSFLQSCDSVPHNGVFDDNNKIWTGEDLFNPVITAVQVAQSLASSFLVLRFILSDCRRSYSIQRPMTYPFCRAASLCQILLALLMITITIGLQMC